MLISLQSLITDVPPDLSINLPSHTNLLEQLEVSYKNFLELDYVSVSSMNKYTNKIRQRKLKTNREKNKLKNIKQKRIKQKEKNIKENREEINIKNI